MPGNIWDFEHIVTKERHYAVWKRRSIKTKLSREGNGIIRPGESWRSRA